MKNLVPIAFVAGWLIFGDLRRCSGLRIGGLGQWFAAAVKSK